MKCVRRAWILKEHEGGEEERSCYMKFKNEIDFLQLLFNCLEYSLISVSLDDNCRAIANPILLTLETRLTFLTISPYSTAYSILTLCWENFYLHQTNPNRLFSWISCNQLTNSNYFLYHNRIISVYWQTRNNHRYQRPNLSRISYFNHCSQMAMH